jgi:Flp pilus assembly protein TadD/ferredoxin
MFIWPQIARIMEGRPLPRPRIVTDTESWASFATTDFWRNLPEPWVAALTFLTCGFAIVYFLGSRSFCKYACPYGVLFGLADRVAPGRIIARGSCEGCGLCTAACSSHIRVHEELTLYGKVVNPSCLKDLDCVAACPDGNVAYGFTRPALLQSWMRSGRRRIRYDFSLREDVLMGATFLATLAIFRGLYGYVPFLMCLGLGCIFAYVAVVAVRLGWAANVRLNNFQLKRAGRLTSAGRVFALISLVLAAFTAHSALIRFHEAAGRSAYDRVVQIAAVGGLDDDSRDLASARRHLAAVDRLGVIDPPYVRRRLASLHLLGDDPEGAAPYLARMNRGARSEAHRLAGRASAAKGDHASAIASFRLSLEDEPDHFQTQLALGESLAETGRFADAADHYGVAASLRPDSGRAHYNLGVILTQLERTDQAVEHYRAAAKLLPDDPEVHNNLGLLLATRGEFDDAATHFRRAIEADSEFAHAHFNLARILVQHDRLEEAEEHLRTAARLDPIYRDILDQLSGSDGDPP